MLSETVQIIHQYGYDTEIIAASIRHPTHVLDAAEMGCDIATIPYDILKKMVAHPKTDEGIAKKTSEGMSKREAVRCLCRYIAREVFKLLTRPQGTPCDQGGLAARRKALGISQAQAAQATGLTRSKVGRLERLAEYHTESLGAYHAFLSEMELKLGLDNI